MSKTKASRGGTMADKSYKMQIDIPWSEVCRLAEEMGYVLFPKDLLAAFAETRDNYREASTSNVTVNRGE